MKTEAKNALQAKATIRELALTQARVARLDAGEPDSERFKKLASENTGATRAMFSEAADCAFELEKNALTASERVEYEEMKVFVRGELERGEKQIAERQAAIAEGAETLKTLRSEVSAAKSGNAPTGGGGVLNAYAAIRDPEARAAFYAQHKEAIRRELKR